MTALKWITADALVAMLASPAHADVTGPVCVTDGDTLVVNGMCLSSVGVVSG
ncbi:MAG: hypothetical protein IIA30_15160 [Myxococcales bacterium]|nr:hypothetical protein [Myxococcales bacterium]